MCIAREGVDLARESNSLRASLPSQIIVSEAVQDVVAFVDQGPRERIESDMPSGIECLCGGMT
jgi:hypothetical protein